ncbi:hypothetical protein GCM10027076_09520 [Nocardioides montaniterrae]
MDKKTWVKPSVKPLTAAKDAQLLGSTVSDGLLGKANKSS